MCGLSRDLPRDSSLAPTAWRRVIAILAILLCLLVVTFNGWYFIIWVTRTCVAQETLK
jgi:TRAP-type C4-dicarboxylate transport system permease small subunit